MEVKDHREMVEAMGEHQDIAEVNKVIFSFWLCLLQDFHKFISILKLFNIKISFSKNAFWRL